MVEFRKQNWWFNEPIFNDFEELIVQIAANHTQGKRAVGGCLFVTDRRVVFVPNRFDALLGGQPFQVPLNEIVDVGIANPRYALAELFSGAFRSRLRIKSSGSEHLFVVNSPKRTLDLFRSLKII